MPKGRLIKRNVTADHGRTSMRLEPEMWDALVDLSARQGITLTKLIHEVGSSGNAVHRRTSALRVYALNYYREAASEAGHAKAGHGRWRRAADG